MRSCLVLSYPWLVTSQWNNFRLALLIVWAPSLSYACLPALGWNNWADTACCSYKRVFNEFIYLEVYGLVLPAILTIAGMTGRVLYITKGQLKDICRLHRSVERGRKASDREQRLNLRYTRSCWVPYLIDMHVCIAFLLRDTKRNSTTHIILSCTGNGSMAVVPMVLGLSNREYTEPASKLLRKIRDRVRGKQGTPGKFLFRKK
uniref:G-protein coupled receptors family 2 profile 2 domain-containing protein n=1 Tax=Neogobius melanostomus TaxID=47308 RepID=A0A8C6UPB2_9GOBI